MTGSFHSDVGLDASAAAPALYREPQWYACYTRARAEKQVARRLVQRGIDSYVALIPRERHWKDRRKLIEFPLFPNYVFGRFALSAVHTVLTTPGVASLVRQHGAPAPIAEAELENVRRFAWALGRAGVEPEARPLVAEGERVRVIEGPFIGVEGMVVESRGRKRVVVGIGAIGRGLEIDIDTRLLKRLAD